MEYSIRWMKEKDVKDLGLIHSDSWRAAYAGIIPNEVLEMKIAKRQADRFLYAYKNKSEETAILLINQSICGFITLGNCRDEDLDEEYGEIRGIYLSPKYYNKGFGKILLRWGLSELKCKGFTKASLWVLEENLIARKFYEKNGLKFDGTEKTINVGKELNELRYSIEL